MPTLFVYGTLKKGFVNEPILAEEVFLGRCVLVEPRYRLYEVQGNYPYPALVGSDQGYQVYGELYGVRDACLPLLDQLEGVSFGLYSRTFVKVALEDGRLFDQVLAYEFMRSTADKTHIGPVWPMRELPRYRLADKRLQCRRESVERPMVQLWNRKQDASATGFFQNEQQLIEFCSPRRKIYGASALGESWNPKWFEIRHSKEPVEIERWRITEGETESPKFDSLDEVADWAAENMNFFGGQTAGVGVWKTAMLDLI